MGSLFKKVFGGSEQKSTSTAPTGFQTLPQEAQDAFIKKFLSDALSTYDNGGNFTPTPLNSQITDALGVLGSGTRSSDYGPNIVRAGDLMNTASGFLSGVNGAMGRSDSFLDSARGFLGDASGYLRDASGNIGQGTAPITSAEFNSELERFRNPFVTDVIDAFAKDTKRNASGLFSDLSSGATMDNAFGSTRQAVAEAELGRNVADVIANKAAQERENSYTFSADRAQNSIENMRNRFLQAAGLNINQAGTAVNQAGTAVSGANSAQNAGGLLINAANSASGIGTAVKNLRSIERGETLDNASNLLSSGEYLRNFDEALRQIPFARTQFLGDVLKYFPTGGGQTSSSSGSNETGGFGGFLGTLAKGSGLFSSFF